MPSKKKKLLKKIQQIQSRKYKKRKHKDIKLKKKKKKKQRDTSDEGLIMPTLQPLKSLKPSLYYM